MGIPRSETNGRECSPVTLLDRQTGWPPKPRTIRTPVLGFVELDPLELWLLDVPAIQRLRRIHQLAFSHYVFPGADHSRFLHTLSVVEMGTRILNRMEKTSSASLGDAASWAKRRRLFRLAALFHDVGHPPFSHAGEEVLPARKQHEDFSLEVLENYGDVIEDYCSDVTVAEVASLLDPREPRADPENQVVLDLLNGEIDADKLAYLLDDSYFCGVTYGQYDVRRFIETSRAYRDDFGVVRQALEWGGLHVAEEVIVARYKMLIQVYFHRTRRAYDHILAEFLKKLLDGARLPADLAAFLLWDDARVLYEARRVVDDASADEDLRLWADRLINRHHVSAVFDPPTTKFDRQEAHRYIGPILRLEEQLRSDRREWWHDNAEKLPHRLTPDTGRGVVVLDERDRPQSLYEKSPIVRALTEEIHLFRVYAALGWDDELEKYREVWQKQADLEQQGLDRLL
jgi:HD superfamily phosphohydrolase